MCIRDSMRRCMPSIGGGVGIACVAVVGTRRTEGKVGIGKLRKQDVWCELVWTTTLPGKMTRMWGRG